MGFLDNLNKNCSKGAKVDVSINGGEGGGGVVYWNSILNKPLQFPPTAHTHTISDVDGLSLILSNINSSLEDTVTEAELTPLLEEKAYKVHTHTISQVNGLQSELDGKQPSGDYATTTALTSGLAGKADTVHTHTISQINGLQSALDSKADESDIPDISGLVTQTELTNGLSGKADTVHTHTISQVDDLQDELDSKVTLTYLNSQNFATESYVDGLIGDIETILNSI